VGDADGAAELTEIKRKVLDAMRPKFRPEFLNRLDEIVVFNPLRKSMLADIVRLEVAAIAQRLNATYQASLWVEPDAVEQLALSGFDAAYGARPLKRLVTKALESPLSRRSSTTSSTPATPPRSSSSTSASRCRFEVSRRRQGRWTALQGLREARCVFAV